MAEIILGFIPETISVPLADILLTRKLQEGAAHTRKFKQIRSSIEEVGLIEPLSVSPKAEDSKHYSLLDGHVRFFVLKEMGYAEVPCLVARDDEGYTYNNRINRLSTIQEHVMIRRAIDRGVSKDRLAKALNIDIRSMDKKIALLDGISPRVVELLKDRQFPPDISRILRKMKPVRQVEAIELMLAADTITVGYAEALLVATPSDQLLSGEKPKKLRGLNPEQMQKMEREMANCQSQYRLVEETYGQDTMNFVLTRGYIAKLIENREVSRHLRMNHPEILKQFQSVIETASLEQ